MTFRIKNWAYLNLKAIALYFVAQDLTFHFSNDLLLGGLGSTSQASVLHTILFLFSMGLLVRLIFEVYTKFVYPDRLSYLRVDTVRLDLSFESLQIAN